MLVEDFGDFSGDSDEKLIKRFSLHTGKRYFDRRNCTLHRHHSFVPAYSQSLEQICSVREGCGKKAVQHVDRQCLPESSGTGDERDVIIVSIPVRNKRRLVHIKLIIVPDLFKFLDTASHNPHDHAPFRSVHYKASRLVYGHIITFFPCSFNVDLCTPHVLQGTGVIVL